MPLPISLKQSSCPTRVLGKFTAIAYFFFLNLRLQASLLEQASRLQPTDLQKEYSLAWPYWHKQGPALVLRASTSCHLTPAPCQGDSLAIYDCMMVKGGSYKSASSAFWLAFWSLQAVRETCHTHWYEMVGTYS